VDLPSRDGSINIGDRVPSRSRNLSLLCSVPTSSGILSSAEKCQGLTAEHSPPLRGEVMNGEAIPPLLHAFHGMVLKNNNNNIIIIIICKI
jgi:hypothetical protein